MNTYQLRKSLIRELHEIHKALIFRDYFLKYTSPPKIVIPYIEFRKEEYCAWVKSKYVTVIFSNKKLKFFIGAHENKELKCIESINDKDNMDIDFFYRNIRIEVTDIFLKNQLDKILKELNGTKNIF